MLVLDPAHAERGRPRARTPEADRPAGAGALGTYYPRGLFWRSCAGCGRVTLDRKEA